MEEAFAKIKETGSKLCADFNTISAEQKVWADSNDQGIVHESTGKYVTESTVGFFPSREIAAYKFCTLFSALVDLYTSGDKDIVPLIEKRFHEAVWEGFSNPTNPDIRKKKPTFRTLRLDVTPNEYNNLMADIYDQGVFLLKQAQQNKDQVGEQIFGSISNLATVCSDANVAPFSFPLDFQAQALDFIEKALRAKFYLK